jgi:hypothetical protein
VEKPYHIGGKESREGSGRYLGKNGQVLPLKVEMITVLGRAHAEAVLRLSAEGVAGPPGLARLAEMPSWPGWA